MKHYEGKSMKHNTGKSSVMAPEHKSTTVRGSHMRKESAGVKYGLSMREDCETESMGLMIDNDINSVTGNATERILKNPKTNSATEKGHDFEIC